MKNCYFFIPKFGIIFVMNGGVDSDYSSIDKLIFLFFHPVRYLLFIYVPNTIDSQVEI